MQAGKLVGQFANRDPGPPPHNLKDILKDSTCGLRGGCLHVTSLRRLRKFRKIRGTRRDDVPSGEGEERPRDRVQLAVDGG
jgi:hypothetical protein